MQFLLFIVTILSICSVLTGFTTGSNRRFLLTSKKFLFGNPEPSNNANAAPAKKDGGLFGTCTSNLIHKCLV